MLYVLFVTVIVCQKKKFTIVVLFCVQFKFKKKIKVTVDSFSNTQSFIRKVSPKFFKLLSFYTVCIFIYGTEWLFINLMCLKRFVDAETNIIYFLRLITQPSRKNFGNNVHVLLFNINKPFSKTNSIATWKNN